MLKRPESRGPYRGTHGPLPSTPGSLHLSMKAVLFALFASLRAAFRTRTAFSRSRFSPCASGAPSSGGAVRGPTPRSRIVCSGRGKMRAGGMFPSSSRRAPSSTASGVASRTIRIETGLAASAWLVSWRRLARNTLPTRLPLRACRFLSQMGLRRPAALEPQPLRHSRLRPQPSLRLRRPGARGALGSPRRLAPSLHRCRVRVRISARQQDNDSGARADR